MDTAAQAGAFPSVTFAVSHRATEGERGVGLGTLRYSASLELADNNVSQLEN